MPRIRALPGLAIAALLTFAQPVAATDMTAMSDTERAVFGEEVRAYLLEHPEVLMEAIAVLEKRQADAQQSTDAQIIQSNAKAIFEDEGSFVGGNPDGDITIVEFMDYNCGYCKKAYPEVASLLSSDGNIRFVVKEFPILGESSVLAARFALAVRSVAGDEAYESIHNALMELRGGISQPALDRLASDHSIDIEAVKAEMNSDAVNSILAQNQKLAQELQITGTPTFVMGDQMLRGYVPLDGMQQIVADIRQN